MRAFEHGLFALSQRALRRAAAAAPKSADAQLLLGEIAYSRGDARDAHRSFSRALDLEPGNADALIGLAASLHSIGRESEAVYFYLSYLQARPDDVLAILSLAAAFQTTGQDDEALEMFERAIELEPDSADVRGQYGRALYELGWEEEAADQLREAARLGSRDTEVYRALGLVLEGEQRWDEAREQYEKAIEVDPSNAQARLQLAAALSDRPPVSHEDGLASRAHAAAAVEMLRQQGASPEEIAGGLWQLGWTHYVAGELAEAIRVDREALAHDPTLDAVRFNLALALLRSGHRDEALSAYQTALGELQDEWYLKHHGIADLETLSKDEPNLPGLDEARSLLSARYDMLKQGRERAPRR